MRAFRNVLVVLAVLLAMILGAAIGGFYLFTKSHIKVNGVLYDTHTELVDLRGTDVSVAEYEAVRKALPRAEVHWDVPFQGQRYADDIQELTVSYFGVEDIEGLDYLPRVNHIDAMECRNYDALAALKQRHPEIQVDFCIHLGDQRLDQTVTSLEIEPGTVTGEELSQALPYLPGVTSITLHNPTIPAAELYAIAEANPQITMIWDKEFMGKTYDMSLKELDISGSNPESLQYVEDTMAYFPNLNKIVMDKCGFDYDDLAAYRDRVREQYKVVWGVPVGQAYLLTDATAFIPSNENKRVFNKDTVNLKYCEDLIAVDFGHINVGALQWVSGTPHLKYLIVGDGNVFNEDIKHLSCLKELEFLEIFKTPVTDISPLIECTALRDLLLSGSYIELEPLTRMPWLENVWLLDSGVNAEEAEYLREKVPNAHFEVGGTTHSHARGWRDLPRYFDMRDTLGMGYMIG